MKFPLPTRYSNLQVSNLEATEEKPHLVAVSLEFDASSVKSGVQHGVIESDATYHLLVHRQQHIMDFESSL